MPHEVVTIPSTVTVLSANLPGLVCTSEIEREPIEAHAPPNAAAAMMRPMTKFRVRPIAFTPQTLRLETVHFADGFSLGANRLRADRERAAEGRRCQRLPDSSPPG